MDQLLPVIIIAQSLVCLGLIVLVIRLYRQIAGLSSSFAKMGFVVREDLKQVFQQAADQNARQSLQIAEKNQQAIEQAMAKVLEESGSIMSGTLAKAHQQAGDIINQANVDKQAILQQAKQDSYQYLDKLADYSTQAVEWAMTQLLKEEVSLDEHQHIIQSLVEVYLDEQKRS